MTSTRTQSLASQGAAPARSEVDSRLRRMLQMRLMFAVAVFLSGAIFFRTSAAPLYMFTGALFLLTVVYVFLLKSGFDSKLLANLQISVDVFLVTSLIGFTGWENSEFSFLYILPIITTSLFFQLRQTIAIALFSSILYASAVLFHRYHLSREVTGSGFEVLYSLYIRTIIFSMVGYLCGHLSNLLKKEKEELSELKDLHHLVLSSMSSGVITTDAVNRVIYANRAAEEILGLPLAKVYNKYVGEFFADGENSSLHEVLETPSRDRGSAERRKLELQAQTAAGKRIPIGFNLSPIRDRSGRTVGKVMLFSDLTDVKELERRVRAIDKFRAAGELAAGIAHEIRNPLTSITGSIEMLADSPELSQANRELLSVVLRESFRLNGIIEDFLAYARKGSLDMKKEDLCEIIKESIEMLERGGRLTPNVRIEWVRPPQPAIVSADRPQMNQVFLNLLSNAVEAIEGAGRIYVRVDPPKGSEDSYSVTIADTGRGMRLEQLGRVFEPFFTTKKDGVGIGLCIAEKIIRQHNGHIQIVSQEGKGTSATVVIPREQGVGEVDEEPRRPGRPAEKRRGHAEPATPFREIAAKDSTERL